MAWRRRRALGGIEAWKNTQTAEKIVLAKSRISGNWGYKLLDDRSSTIFITDLVYSKTEARKKAREWMRRHPNG